MKTSKKKIITLSLSFVVFTAAFAQSPKIEEAKDVITGRKKTTQPQESDRSVKDVILGRRTEDQSTTRYPDGTYGSRESQIEQVNREYDQKINSIRNNPYLSAEEKDRMIRQLEAERRRKIKSINNRYEDRDDDDDYKSKKVKKNNGNHYGWEKGVGNPHRTGSTKHTGKTKSKGKKSKD